MKYMISDIHGCYDQYMALLEKIHFSSEDELYVLGDVADRGPDPIKVFQDLLQRKNVTYILGNHDYMFLYFMGKNGLDLADKNLADCDSGDVAAFRMWLMDGGVTTAKQFMELGAEDRAAVNGFLENAKAYAVIEMEGKVSPFSGIGRFMFRWKGENPRPTRYILMHAGIRNFQEDKPLEAYDLIDFLDMRTDYSRRYYADRNTFVITGHTPTMCIHKDQRPEVYQGNGHIAIDCGCVYGGKLAAYVLETGKTVYVEGRKVYPSGHW